MTKSIPPNRDWQLPFIKLLSDEKPHTRGEIITAIADQMDLNEAQRQQKFSPKGQRIVVNRVAWCDVMFCKAGFTTKDASSKNNMEHIFRITSLGLEEVTQNPEKINSTYLHTFWK